MAVAPQPNDWGETSKRQTIGLTEYMLASYNIDPDMVYISGYSGGGETLSLAVSEKPELYTAALHVSSKCIKCMKCVQIRDKIQGLHIYYSSHL